MAKSGCGEKARAIKHPPRGIMARTGLLCIYLLPHKEMCLTSNPHKVAMLKLNNVPANTYSVLAVSVSLKRSKDFAATINPTASYCPIRTKTIASILSKLPINAPAFFILRQDSASPILYLPKINLMRMLVGFKQHRIANANNGIDKESTKSMFWIGRLDVGIYRHEMRHRIKICANWSVRKDHRPLHIYVFIASINKCVPPMIKAKIPKSANGTKAQESNPTITE